MRISDQPALDAAVLPYVARSTGYLKVVGKRWRSAHFVFLLRLLLFQDLFRTLAYSQVCTKSSRVILVVCTTGTAEKDKSSDVGHALREVDHEVPGRRIPTPGDSSQ